jgi:hypothetical protein
MEHGWYRLDTDFENFISFQYSQFFINKPSIPSKVYLIRHKLLLPLQKFSKKREIHGY